MARTGRPKRDDLALLNLAAEVWDDDGPEINFLARLHCLIGLPYRDPGDVPAWGRRNGNLSLLVQPGVQMAEDGTTSTVGYPYGTVPRLLLTWALDRGGADAEPQPRAGGEPERLHALAGPAADRRQAGHHRTASQADGAAVPRDSDGQVGGRPVTPGGEPAQRGIQLRPVVERPRSQRPEAAPVHGATEPRLLRRSDRASGSAESQCAAGPAGECSANRSVPVADVSDVVAQAADGNSMGVTADPVRLQPC